MRYGITITDFIKQQKGRCNFLRFIAAAAAAEQMCMNVCMKVPPSVLPHAAARSLLGQHAAAAAVWRNNTKCGVCASENVTAAP
jgi:hypothetical protein